MAPVIFRSGRRITESDIQALAEYLHSADAIEAQLHRLLERHPAIIGALGFHEFLSEFPIRKRDQGNQPLTDIRSNNRADLLAARLDVASDLRAVKFANVIELKGSNARVLDSRTGRRSPILNAAVEQLRDYSRSLFESSNREVLAKFGWDVWRPSKIVIMGSRGQFGNPGQLEQIKQDLLETEGVQLVPVDDLLAYAEMERRRPDAEQLVATEGLVELDQIGRRFFVPLIVASSGLAGFILARTRLEGVVTSYGNIDIREGLPSGLVHLTELRLQPIARKLEVPFAEAIVGFNKFRSGNIKWYGPVTSGIVVADFDAQVIRSALEQRELRNQPLREKAQARRYSKLSEKRQHAQRFADTIKKMFPLLSDDAAGRIAAGATRPGSGRVGTDSTLHLGEAVWLAVAAYAAYEYLGIDSKEKAHRSEEKVQGVLRSWGGPEPDTILRQTVLLRARGNV